MAHTTTSSGFGLPVFGAIHMLAFLAVLIGVLFLIILAVKTLTHKQLKTWGLWLTVGGIIVCALTIGAMGHSKVLFTRGNVGFAGARMMQLDSDDVTFTRSLQGGGMDMSMNGMTMMLQGASGDDFDAAFLAMMIPHHQGAIDMAELAAKNAKHQEVKDLAKSIIGSQQKEIDEMQSWEKAWGYTK